MRSKANSERASKSGSRNDNTNILIVILIAFVAYELGAMFLNLPFFIDPILLSLGLLIIFSLLYVYRLRKRDVVRVYAKVVARVLAAVILIAAFIVLLGVGQTCAGLFGAQTSCVDMNYFTVTILLLNPFSLILWSALTTSGIIALLMGTKDNP